LACTILGVEKAETNPTNLKVTLNTIDNNNFVIDPFLMNSLNFVTINIILSGYTRGAFPVSASAIAGVSQIKYINAYKFENKKFALLSKYAGYTIFFLVGLTILIEHADQRLASMIIAIIIIILFILFFIYKFRPLFHKLVSYKQWLCGLVTGNRHQ
jgi:hypothetical protein